MLEQDTRRLAAILNNFVRTRTPGWWRTVRVRANNRGGGHIELDVSAGEYTEPALCLGAICLFLRDEFPADWRAFDATLFYEGMTPSVLQFSNEHLPIPEVSRRYLTTSLAIQSGWKRDFVSAFEETNVFVLPPEGAAELAVPETTREFLTTVGLPENPVSWVHVELELGRLPTLSEYSQMLSSRFPSARSLRRLGDVIFHVLCLAEESGAIVTVDSRSGAVEFMNSSVEQFAHSVLLARRHHGKALTRRLRKLDQACLQEGAFWYWHIANEGCS